MHRASCRSKIIVNFASYTLLDGQHLSGRSSAGRCLIIIHSIVRTSHLEISIIPYTSINSWPVKFSVFRMTERRTWVLQWFQSQAAEFYNTGYKSWSHGMTNVSIPEVNMLKNSWTLAVSVPINLSINLGFVSVNGSGKLTLCMRYVYVILVIRCFTERRLSAVAVSKDMFKMFSIILCSYFPLHTTLWNNDFKITKQVTTTFNRSVFKYFCEWHLLFYFNNSSCEKNRN